MNTGNNLLYLLLGAMLGAVAVSGWVSEHTLRNLHVVRTTPGGVPVERDFRLRYRVTNRKRWLPSLAVELKEPGLPGLAFIPRVSAGETVDTHATDRFVRRGVYPLEELTLATEFPFGLFRKEREVALPGELVVWPRTDRVVREDLVGSGNDRSTPSASTHPATGPRGEFRSLREYRPGDDARDIHWRTSARLRQPVIREYEREAAEATWIVLDVGDPPGDEAEAAVEVAAALCARAARLGQPFALFAGSRAVGPGTGEAHLERALDVLARVDFGGEATSYPPESRDRAVLVTPGRIHPGFPQVIRTAGAGVPEAMADLGPARAPGRSPT